MRSTRFFLFIVMIALGIVLGLIYGWIINPVKYQNTSPEMLRSDYKADYVLMVAQIYQREGDITKASQRLSLLGSQASAQIAMDGLKTAGDLGYAAADMEQMTNLVKALQQPVPVSPPKGQP